MFYYTNYLNGCTSVKNYIMQKYNDKRCPNVKDIIYCERRLKLKEVKASRRTLTVSLYIFYRNMSGLK